jgi:hypothetical protein
MPTGRTEDFTTTWSLPSSPISPRTHQPSVSSLTGDPRWDEALDLFRTRGLPVSDAHSFTFPDEPRGELDVAIDNLVARAHDVLKIQGRLRSLLKANQAVIEHLELPVVLERIVGAAVELVGAKYGALGVVAPDGSLEQFINVGMTADEVAAIGHLPAGHGLLGALIDEPHP